MAVFFIHPCTYIVWMTFFIFDINFFDREHNF